LESIEGGEKWARYSFFGFDPKARLYCKDGVVTIEGEGAKVVETKKLLANRNNIIFFILCYLIKTW